MIEKGDKINDPTEIELILSSDCLPRCYSGGNGIVQRRRCVTSTSEALKMGGSHEFIATSSASNASACKTREPYLESVDRNTVSPVAGAADIYISSGLPRQSRTKRGV